MVKYELESATFGKMIVNKGSESVSVDTSELVGIVDLLKMYNDTRRMLPQCARKLPKDAENPIANEFKIPSLHFSLRQLEILSLRSNGLGYEEIAQELGIARQTVKNHMLTLVNTNCLEEKGEVFEPDSLMVYAYLSGLLYPISLMGLETLAGALKNQK